MELKQIIVLVFLIATVGMVVFRLVQGAVQKNKKQKKE